MGHRWGAFEDDRNILILIVVVVNDYSSDKTHPTINFKTHPTKILFYVNYTLVKLIYNGFL